MVHKPLALLAELTHRCPLGCPYCSNPLALDAREDELDTATWVRVFREAAQLGVLQVHLSGGEPGARRDLVEITAGAHAAGLYTNLITSAVGITEKSLGRLAEAGLDHVQISIQDSDAQSADHIAGYAGAFVRKRALAAEVVRHKLPLTVNAVVHRANIDGIGDMVDLALALGAGRVEIAHVQYYGWAIENRAALMPSREQVERATAAVEELRARHHGRIVIDAVVPDYYARYPKPCVGGWGRRSLNVTPAGKVLPCHAAESISRLEFWNVHDQGGSHAQPLLAAAGALARRDARDRARSLPGRCPAVDTHAHAPAAHPQPADLGRGRQAARHQPSALRDGRGQIAGPAAQAAEGIQDRSVHERRAQCALAAPRRQGHGLRQQSHPRQGLCRGREGWKARTQSHRLGLGPAERPRLPRRHALHRRRHESFEARKDRGQSRQSAEARRHLRSVPQPPVARLEIHRSRARQ